MILPNTAKYDMTFWFFSLSLEQCLSRTTFHVTFEDSFTKDMTQISISSVPHTSLSNTSLLSQCQILEWVCFSPWGFLFALVFDDSSPFIHSPNVCQPRWGNVLDSTVLPPYLLPYIWRVCSALPHCRKAWPGDLLWAMEWGQIGCVPLSSKRF